MVHSPIESRNEWKGSVLFTDKQTVAAGGVGGIARLWKLNEAIDFQHWNVHAAGAGADSVAISDDGMSPGGQSAPPLGRIEGFKVHHL